jgi:hypothetical protein
MAVIENTTLTTDLEPAISIDHTSRLVENIQSLQEVLGITEMQPMAAGTQIKQYKLTKVNSPDQVAEGEVINLTKIKRTLANTYELKLNKYRRLTTAEDIQKVGHDTAVNKTDGKLIGEVRKDIKANFFTMLGTGTGTAKGTNLQTTLSALWGKLKIRYEDIDATPVFFINPEDVADYLGTAQITMQTVFGLNYIESFLGLGTAILSSKITKGAPVATVKENLNGAYVPASGDVAQDFGLTFDESGLVGMCHNIASDRASIDTLILSGALFYPEELDGVFKGTITPSTGA